MTDLKSPFLREWIDHVFDHPVPIREPAWHDEPDAPVWEGSAEQIVRNIAETFEESGRLLGRFSNAQLNQGFWYLVFPSQSEFMSSLVDEKVPMPLRLRALRSFVPLFKQVMTVRCSPHLSHLNEPGADALNCACYMWWDILPIDGCPEDSSRAEFDAEALLVLQQVLELPHDACRESALHGLGHWSHSYPQTSKIIDGFLANTTNLRRELITYALQAKSGSVL